MARPADEINLPEPSKFALAIMKIAEEEGDYISEATLNELEASIEIDSTPQKYVAAVALPRIEITPDQLNKVKQVVNVVKGMAKAGKFLSKKLGKYLGPVGAVAGVVVELIDFFEEKKEDPVMKELGELRSQLTALSEKMTAQFNDLKAFMVEQDFYNRYTIAMNTLLMYMIDTLTGGKRSVIAFEGAYKEHNPQKLVYEMLAKIELDATNPLKLAMKGDNLQSKATFEKWQGVLEGALTQALFLETYASGLFPEVDSYGVTKILEKIGRYDELVKQWNEYYLETDDFWPQGVQQLVDEVHEKTSLTTPHLKIDAIWDGILSIHTNFKFYVVVVSTDHIYRYYKHYESQAIISERNGFVVMVYRSARKPARDRQWLLQYMYNNMNTKEYMFMQYNHWSIVRYHLKQKHIDKIGQYLGTFYFVVAQSSEHIASKFSMMEGSDGPGHFTFNATLKCDDGFSSTTAPLFKLYGN